MPLRRVLVLYSDERLLPANIIADEAIRATFAGDAGNHIEFYSEFLDVSRFPGETQQRQRDFFRDKYQKRPPDLVIAGGDPALEFLLKYRTTLFSGVPIVIVGWRRLCPRRCRTQGPRGFLCSGLPPPPWSWLSVCSRTLVMLRW
jgi:hypothetical protein